MTSNHVGTGDRTNDIMVLPSYIPLMSLIVTSEVIAPYARHVLE